MPQESRTFKGTPRTAALWQPFVSAPHPGTDTGEPWGLNMETKCWYCGDEMELRELGIINGTMWRVDGVRESGKSSFVKYRIRMAAGKQAGVDPLTGRPHWLRTLGLDGKPEGGRPEMQDVFESIGGEIIDPLAGDRKINPYDPELNDLISMVDKTRTIAELVLKRKPQGYEALAALVGTALMFHKFRRVAKPELLGDIFNGLTKSDAEEFYAERHTSLVEQAREMLTQSSNGTVEGDLAFIAELEALGNKSSNLPEDEFARAAATMASVMTRFTGEEFDNAFGGGSSLHQQLSGRAVLIDRSRMSAQTREAFDTFYNGWLTFALVHNRIDLVPHLRVSEEIQADFESAAYLRALDNLSRKSRAFHMVDIGLTQFGRQLNLVGHPDSEIRQLAKSINMGVTLRAMFRQPYDPDVLDYLVNTVRLSDEDAFLTTGLQQGCYALKIGEQPVLWLQNIIPPSILQDIDTNSVVRRMRERVNAYTLDDVRARAKRAEQEYQKGQVKPDEAVA